MILFLFSLKSQSDNEANDSSDWSRSTVNQNKQENLMNINNEKIRLKLENCETYWHYFLSYQMHNFDSIVDSYIKYGPSVFLDCIQIEKYDSSDSNKRMSHNKLSTNSSNSGKEELDLSDIKMELMNQVPHVDRQGFPISHLADIIPRLLFTNREFKVKTSSPIPDEVSATSVYITSVGEYAYIVGLLIYEDLSVFHGKKILQILSEINLVEN